MRAKSRPGDPRPVPPATLTLKLRVQVHDDHRRALAARKEGGQAMASPRQCTVALERVLERFLETLKREGEEIFRKDLERALRSM